MENGLLERQAVLAKLVGFAGRAGRGAGQTVLLRGEAGVGKTALIARLVAGLNGSWRVLRGWCDSLAAPRPLGPLIDMLTDLSGEQAARLRAAIDAGDAEAIYARLLRLFGDGARWVCVIEDAHWADGATLDLLRFLARRVDKLPLLLVVSYRDDEVGDQHPLAVLLGDLATSPAVARIGLDALSAAAVARLAAGSGVNAEALYRLSGGNPFYVTEVLADGADALFDGRLPRSVSEAVWGRLARLSSAGRETAQAAAVCGPRASPALVQAVCPGAAGGLAECLQAGVLVAEADTVGFRHELARRATADKLPDFQRRLLHKRALTVLSEPPIDPNVLGALAFHAEQAGDTDAVIQYAPAAAERAALLGAHTQAADLCALTLRHAGTAAVEQKVTWLEQYAFESYLCGRAAASMSAWREAIQIRHQLGHRLEEGDDLRWLSHLLEPLGRTCEAVEAGRASLQLLDGLGPSPQLAWSLINMAHSAAAVSYDPPAAAEYAERAMALGTQLGDQAVVIRARGYQAIAHILRTGTGWDELEAAWQAALQTPGLTEHAGVLSVLICWIAVLRCELHRAEGYTARASAFCDENGLGMFQALVSGADALAALYRGNWSRAVQVAELILTRPELSPQHRILPLVTVALIRARRGERPNGLLDEALEFTAGNILRLHVWAARAEAAWLAGDDDTAVAEAQAALAALPGDADSSLVESLRRWVWLAGGEPDPSDDPLTGAGSDTGENWRAAADAWTRRGCPYETAIAQLGGDIDALQAALGTFRRLGARAAARRAQQHLAALRGRTPSTRRADTLADPDGLTRRERQVLDLLAGGHSDAQIAVMLHISPKTAGCHVSSILAKLKVDNRIQAAARALQRQTTPQS